MDIIAECETDYQTNIAKPYTVTRYKYNTSEIGDEESDTPIFATSSGDLLSKQFNKVGQIPNFEQMRGLGESTSYSDFTHRVSNWKQQFIDFSKTAMTPVSLSHAVPRLPPPQIISPEEWADFSAHRRLVRQFNAETSPLGPENFIHVSNILQQGSEYNPEEVLPAKGLNDSAILLKYHLNKGIPWSSKLIPQRTSPTLYSTFAEYESAMLRWSELVENIDFLPPSPQQVGHIVNLKQEDDNQFVAPPPPLEPHEMPIPLSDVPVNEKKISKYLRKLKRSYVQSISTPPVIFDKPIKYHSLIPAHAHVSSAAAVVQQISELGLPFAPLHGSSLTRMLREERSIFDVGLMAKGHFTKSGPPVQHRRSSSKSRDDRSSGKPVTVQKTREEIIQLLETNPKELLLTDFSQVQFQKILTMAIPGTGKTIGDRLYEIIPLDDIIKYSYFSDSERYVAKFSVIVLYVLRLPALYETILELDITALEHFVELIQFTAPHSFPLDLLPEEEINSAIADDPQHEAQIDSIVMDFRQAQLLCTLYSVVFAGCEHFTTFLPFLRKLLHRSYQKVTEIVMNDSLFPKILEGFNSTNLYTHKFYFRLLRTVIVLQYTKTIRVFAGHDLLKFIHVGLDSSEAEIKRDTLSLWQLMVHTDTSIALQLQVIQASPSSVYNSIMSSSSSFQNFLLSIFSLFRETKTMFDFRPFPFAQFHGFFQLFSENINNKRNSLFLYNLLTLCIDSEAIFCFNRKDFIDLIKQFALSASLTLTKEPNTIKMRCLKVLYKISFLDPPSVEVPEVWDFILTEMARKGDSVKMEYRLNAWYTFRNAVLKQSHFVAFVLTNEALTKKLDAAFSSFDDKVIACMVPSLTFLARPMIKVFGIEEGAKNNLIEFFTHLSDPSVSIAAKLLTAFKTSQDSIEIGKMHSYLDQFLTMLIESEKGSVLRTFMNQPHVKSELAEVFAKVAKIHDLPPPFQ